MKMMLKMLAALLYDCLVLMGLIFAVMALQVGLYQILDLTDEQHTWFKQLLILTTLYAYYSVSYYKQGQTIGMKAWKLKLVQQDGSLATRQQILIRWLCAILSVPLLGLGHWSALFRQDRRSLVDLISKTQIISIRK
mgnify:CR=1 FL=1